MALKLPPTSGDYYRLLVHIEGVVRRIARYDKHAVRNDLRAQAMQAMRWVHRAVYEHRRLSEQLAAKAVLPKSSFSKERTSP